MDYTDILSFQESESKSVSVVQICTDLNALSALIQKYVNSGTLAFEEEKKLLDFFLHYKNTNSLVVQALKSINENPTLSHQQFSVLLHATEEFLSLSDCYKIQLSALDFEADCKAYIKPFDAEYSQSVKQANTCWIAFQEASNRLDYLDERADDYADLLKDMNDKEVLYKTAHAQVDETYSILQEKQKDIYVLFSFSLDMLLVVVEKLKQIARSVIDDVSNLKKGDRL